MPRWSVFAVLLLAARLGAADGEWAHAAEAAVESKFVRRGVERAGATLAPALQFTDDTWRLDMWARLPFAHTAEREFGASIGGTHTTAAGARFGLEVAQLVFGRHTDGQPRSTTEFTASASYPAGPGRIEASGTRDLRRRANIAEVGYAGEYALKSWGAFLHYRVYLGAVAAADVLPGRTGARTSDAYTYHGVDLTLPYRIGGETVVTAGLHGAGTSGARPFWSPSGAASGGMGWLSLAVTREF